MPDFVPFWFASRSDYEIKDDRVAPGATSDREPQVFAPKGAATQQPRAERSGVAA